MKNMTIRGIDPELSEKLKRIARIEGKSINQYVVDLLKKQLGLKKEKQFTQTYEDLDHLFGRWSQKEFEQIQGKIDDERRIDDEVWS